PSDETLSFNDMIRGQVSFDTNLVDDKILLKKDNMPTYHLAVVVDDYKMKISHIFRGEEWLPSAPIHALLWEYLGWRSEMPEWAHLPLILKPDGHGKLSKRDGDRLGFPVFAMNWRDPLSGEVVKGFREMGFLTEAFINMLALLGWNDGSDQELFTLEELTEKFSLERINNSGAKFDYEKAKWFNHEWIKKLSAEELRPYLKNILAEQAILDVDDSYLDTTVDLVKDRRTYLTDFWDQASFFFKGPETYDMDAVQPKWTGETTRFFTEITDSLSGFEPLTSEAI